MHLRKRTEPADNDDREALVNTGKHRPFDEARHERGPGLRPTTTRASLDRNDNHRKHVNYSVDNFLLKFLRLRRARSTKRR